jgi:hemoglobin/transferrin/lactoferrin receptor protein
MRTHLLLSTGLLSTTLLLLSATPGLSLDPDSPGDDFQTLPPVTVVATRTQTPLDQVPATVSVFSAERIEAMLATDIKDLIRFEPGVSVVSQPARFGAALGTAGRAGNEGFTIRGLGGDRVLMVVDGVRTPDGFAFGAQSVGRGGYSDLDLMKSVEILRGPASALYGSDGVAGAVSFTTKDPDDLIAGEASFGARARVGYNSSDAGWSQALALAGRNGNLSGLLAYTHRDSEETRTHGDLTGEALTPTGGVTYSNRTRANPQDIRSDAVLAKGIWDFAPNQSLRLTYEGYRLSSDAEILSGRTARVVAAVPPTAATAVLGLTARDTTDRDRLSLDWRLSDVFGLDRGQVSVFGQEAKTRQLTLEDRVGVDRIRDNQFNNRMLGVSVEAVRTFSLGSTQHRLTFGGDSSRTTQEGIRDGTVPPVGEVFPSSPFPKTDYSLSGLYLQNEISLLEGQLRVIPALRLDAYALSTDNDPLYAGDRADQDADHISPKLGLVWQLTPQVQVFGNYGAGFKAPTPSQVNNFFSNLAFGYTSDPNPDLKPETSKSAELGLRLTRLEALNGILNTQIVGFHADYSDFISQQVVSGAFTPSNPAVYQFVNLTTVEVKGLEARAQLTWDNGVSFRFAGAFAEGEQTTRAVSAALPTIDPLKLVWGLGYDEAGGRWGGEAVLTWSGRTAHADTDALECYNPAPSVGCYTGRAFAVIDVMAYWQLTDQVVARAGLFNATDEKYGWWSDIRGVASASPVIDAFTQPGRNLGLSLAWRR